MREVIMPKLGLSMTTGTISSWLKKEGDPVRKGEILFEVVSDKTTIEVEAYESGTLLKILKEEGAEVPVTEVIAYIGEPGEQIAQGGRAAQPKPEKPEEQPVPSRRLAAAESSAEEAAGEKDERIKITPIARRLAKEKGVDIKLVKGTGPDGRIVREDIEDAAASGVPAAGVPVHADASTANRGAAPRAAAKVRSCQPLKGIRKVISERLTWSMQNIPHVTVTTVVDVGPLVDLKQRLQDKLTGLQASKLTISDFMLKAAAMVLAEHPVINSSLVDNQHIVYEDINIGLAVDTEHGLIVPTIYSADKQSIVEIACARKEVIEKTKTFRHTVDDLSNGTFTISNLGMFGIRNFTAIINPPQGAILTVGEIYKSPLVVGDKISVGTLMQVSLVVDHRIIDGADAARYLARLKELLQSPELLVPDALLRA